MSRTSKTKVLSALAFMTTLLVVSSCSSVRLSSVNRPSPTHADSLVLKNLIANIDSIKDILPMIVMVNERRVLTDSSMKDSALMERIRRTREIFVEDRSNETDTFSSVVLFDAVANLFDPKDQLCPLPDKVANKLLAMKKESKPWIPKYIEQYITKLPKLAYTINQKSLSAVLHTIVFERPNGSRYSWELQQAPSYHNFNVHEFINKSGYGTFAYTLDCAGYMNAAIEGAAVVPGADMKAKASTSLLGKNSMFIGGGIVTSPILGAIYTDELGLTMDRVLRRAILQAILNAPGVQDDDIIITQASYEVVWASKSGESSFNGSGNFATQGGVGIGIAQVSGSGSTGGTISRTSAFSSFETYVTTTKRHPMPPVPITRVKELLASLSSSQ